MGGIAYLITSLTLVYSTVYSDADQRKHQSSASLAFVRGIRRQPVNSPHKWPVTRKMFPFHGYRVCRAALSGAEKILSSHFSVTHYGLVTPCGDRDLGLWMISQVMACLIAWRHEAITWNSVGLSSVISRGIHMRLSSYEELKIPISKTRLKICILKVAPRSSRNRCVKPRIHQDYIVGTVEVTWTCCLSIKSILSDVVQCITCNIYSYGVFSVVAFTRFILSGFARCI